MTIQTAFTQAPAVAQSLRRLPVQRPSLSVYNTISGRRRLVLGVLGATSFIGLWALAAYLELASPRLLPTPLQVLTALGELIRDGFLYDVLKSVYRITVSFLLAVLVAYPLGLLIGASASVSAFFSPVVSAFRYLPAPAFVPLLLMWLGAGDGQKVALLFLGVVWFLITVIADHVP